MNDRLEKPVADLRGKHVLLINPPWRLQQDNVWSNVASCYPSLGLAMIASYLEHCGAEVRILDMQADPDGPGVLASMARPDMVGISATTVLAESAYGVCASLRERWPDVPVVFGGVHATIVPREILARHPDCFVIRGEGERSMARLVAGQPDESIKGLARMHNGMYWEHPATDVIENLDEMPMPSYHLLPMKRYRASLGGALRHPSMSVFSTRGCPGRCTFCNSALSKVLRFRSAENVVEEISILMREYGVREIGFYDDTFCADRERVRKICRLLVERRLNVTWSCMSRANFADDETLRWMSRAGCHMICYGVESADAEVLKRLRKGINIDSVRDAVAMTRRHGIRTRLSFMYGSPGETRESMQLSLDFAIRVNPDLVQFNITTPYPGTEMFAWAEQNGLLLTHDWSRYDLYNVVMSVPGLTPEEIQDFYHYSYRRFYLRLSPLARLVWFFISHPGLLSLSIRRGLGLLRRVFLGIGRGRRSGN